MSKKITLEIKATVTLNIDEDVMDVADLELNLISQSDIGDVEDFEITDSRIIDSR